MELISIDNGINSTIKGLERKHMKGKLQQPKITIKPTRRGKKKGTSKREVKMWWKTIYRHFKKQIKVLQMKQHEQECEENIWSKNHHALSLHTGGANSPRAA